MYSRVLPRCTKKGESSALHDKDSIRDKLQDDIYASVDLSVTVPKYKFPHEQHDPRHAYAVVRDELMLDGNARQNLATFCQTWEEPEIHQLMDECIDKNIVDKDEYPQIAEIESRRFARLSWSGIFACRESSQSTPQVISSGWHPWAWAG